MYLRMSEDLIPSVRLYTGNILAVFTALMAQGFELNAVADVIGRLQASPGPMQVVATTPLVIVDYAHTPDALQKALQTLKKFKKQPEAVRKRILRTALEELKGDLRRLTYQHWKEMEELIDSRPINSIVDLPAGISVTKDRTNIILKLIKS